MRQPTLLHIVRNDMVAQTVLIVLAITFGMAVLTTMFGDLARKAADPKRLDDSIFWWFAFTVIVFLGTPFLVDRVVSIRKIFANAIKVESTTIDRWQHWPRWNGIKVTFTLRDQDYVVVHSLPYFKVRDIQIGDVISLIVSQDNPRETVLLQGYEKFID